MHTRPYRNGHIAKRRSKLSRDGIAYGYDTTISQIEGIFSVEPDPFFDWVCSENKSELVVENIQNMY